MQTIFCYSTILDLHCFWFHVPSSCIAHKPWIVHFFLLKKPHFCIWGEGRSFLADRLPHATGKHKNVDVWNLWKSVVVNLNPLVFCLTDTVHMCSRQSWWWDLKNFQNNFLYLLISLSSHLLLKLGCFAQTLILRLFQISFQANFDSHPFHKHKMINANSLIKWIHVLS